MEDTVILIEADYLAAVIDSSGLGQRHPGDIDCGEGGRKGSRCGQGNRAQNQEQHSEHQSMGSITVTRQAAGNLIGLQRLRDEINTDPE